MDHPKELEIFKPTDEELVSNYLLNKVMGRSIPDQVSALFRQCDLYGREEPWEIWERCGGGQLDGSSRLYFFAELKRKASFKSTRFRRRIGEGKWEAETGPKRIGLFGLKRMFSYEGKNGSRPHQYRWVMHEYSLDTESIQEPLPDHAKEYVLCRITRKPNQEKKKRKKSQAPPAEGQNHENIGNESPSNLPRGEEERGHIDVMKQENNMEVPESLLVVEECSVKSINEMEDRNVELSNAVMQDDKVKGGDDAPCDFPVKVKYEEDYTSNRDYEWVKSLAQQLREFADPQDLKERDVLCSNIIPLVKRY